MDAGLLILIAVVALTVVFDFINGFHDAANAIATVVSTRVMRPVTAVVYGCLLNFAGAMMGTEVAETVGNGLVHAGGITMRTVLCAVAAAIVWNIVTWIKGLPTSSSHALIGALIGAAFFSAQGGNGAIVWSNVLDKVVAPMFISPVLGISCGFLFMLALTWAFYRVKLGRINRIFGRLQILSAGVMALSHGRNDAQKSMGIIALALALHAQSGDFSVPLWVKIVCALAMALGTLLGGWRIIRTLGSKMIKLQPIHGFAAEVTASLVIGGASSMGLPLSTTQVITSSIMGVGATKRLSAVRWGVVGNIVCAWVLTMPLAFALGGFFMYAFRLAAG